VGLVLEGGIWLQSPQQMYPRGEMGKRREGRSRGDLCSRSLVGGSFIDFRVDGASVLLAGVAGQIAQGETTDDQR
jgi:hypothetical protein